MPKLWVGLAAVVVLLAGGGALAARRVEDDGGGEARRTTGEFPMTLDGDRDWMLAAFNGEAEPTDGDFRARYSAGFLAHVPPAKMRALVDTLQPKRPWRVLQEVERRADDVLAVQLVGRDDEQARLTMRVGADRKIVAATVLMATPCAPAAPADAPLSPDLAARLGWVKKVIDSGHVPDDDELRATFSPSFLAAVPVDKTRAALEQIHALGPFTYRSYEGPPRERSLTMRVGVSTGEEARLTLTVDPPPARTISGLTVQTQQPCRLDGGG